MFTYNNHQIEIRQNGQFLELWIDGKFTTSTTVSIHNRITPLERFRKHIVRLAK